MKEILRLDISDELHHILMVQFLEHLRFGLALKKVRGSRIRTEPESMLKVCTMTAANLDLVILEA